MADPIIIAKLTIEGIILGKKAFNDVENKEINPDHLVGNPLILFQRLRAAYCKKDCEGIAKTLSDRFEGNLYGCKTKDALLELFGETFEIMPFFVKPKLTILVHQITAASESGFDGIIEFDANMTTLGINVQSIDSGEIRCTAEPEGPHSRWRITKLETI